MDSAPIPTGRADWDDIRGTARTWQYDRYLAATLSPRSARSDLIVLAAFAGNVERIVWTVSEPTIAAIRLQWWHDAISAQSATGNPLADGLIDVMRRQRLPAGLLFGVVETQEIELFSDLVPDLDHLRMHFIRRDGALFNLAARILGKTLTGGDAETVEAAAVAYGLARTLAELKRRMHARQLLVPADRAAAHGVHLTSPPLGEAGPTRRLMVELTEVAQSELVRLRAGLAGQSKLFRAALLPAALTSAYLTSANRQFDAAKSDEMGPSALLKAYRLAKARWTGRF